MGRRDAVQFTLELVAEWRRLGAEVTFEPGWETSGNGQSADYEGGNVHHTGVGSSALDPYPSKRLLVVGRPDLAGPLCNTSGPWCPVNRPRIHVVAAHPANHGGASGGRSMGPMPVTRLYNPRSYGHEIDYGGNVAMAPGQYRAALIFTRGLANVLRRSVEWIRAHAETSVTGKWDPGYAPGRTIDMARFRAEAAALTPGNPGGFLMALDDHQQQEVYDAIVGRKMDYRPHHHRPGDDLLGHILSIRQEVARLTPGWKDDHGHGDVYLEVTQLLPGRKDVHDHGPVYQAWLGLLQAVTGIDQNARLAATREITVDPAKIDLSQVQIPVETRLPDDQMAQLAEMVAQRLADRLRE